MNDNNVNKLLLSASTKSLITTTASMQHRISAGVIIEDDGKLLLVRHVKPGAYDFWVCPGGGVTGCESLEEAAVREAKEEAGIDVTLGQLLYIEEFFNPGCRTLKFWFAAKVAGGQLDWSHPEALAEHITQAAWHPLSDLAQIMVFPTMLQSRYAADKAAGFLSPVRLPLRGMDVW